MVRSPLAWFSTCIFLAPILLNASPEISGTVNRIKVSEEIVAVIGQGTNTVSSRLVEWIDAHGMANKMFVFHAKHSRQMIAVASTNQVFFLRGKLISVSPGLQSFSVATSEVAEANELTEESAIALATSVRGSKSPRRSVDLKPILNAETERRLAQPLLLKSVKIRSAGDDERGVLVEFESYTGLVGSVLLDEQLNPVTMSRSVNSH